MTRDPALARRLWRLLEPVHVVTYFSPEPQAALKDAGYKGYWMGYFAARAAPLGPVGPEVVAAVFCNFSLPHVSRALPDAWGFAPPEAALAARRDGSAAALRRAFGGIDVTEAASLARRAAEAAPLDGRALFAANAALPWPDDPVAQLWHAATLLREHRGDGHVAALVAAGIGGRESNVLHSADGGPAPAVYEVSRRYDPEEWQANAASLTARGLLAADGGIAPAGKALRADIEDRTDRLALTAYDALDDDEIDALAAALRPLTKAVIATGELPAVLPIGEVGDAG